ncbi:hypothetical protein JZ751_016806, partial [Albula glossodonta]
FTGNRKQKHALFLHVNAERSISKALGERGGGRFVERAGGRRRAKTRRASESRHRVGPFPPHPSRPSSPSSLWPKVLINNRSGGWAGGCSLAQRRSPPLAQLQRRYISLFKSCLISRSRSPGAGTLLPLQHSGPDTHQCTGSSGLLSQGCASLSLPGCQPQIPVQPQVSPQQGLSLPSNAELTGCSRGRFGTVIDVWSREKLSGLPSSCGVHSQLMEEPLASFRNLERGCGRSKASRCRDALPGNILRKILLTRYFGNQRLLSKSDGNSSSGGYSKSSGGGGSPVLDSDRCGPCMFEIQCLLDNVGASELVVDLIVSTKNDRVFEESILLGISLLRGGNTQIQNSFYHQLYDKKKSEKFFKVFYDRMKLAQQEIRSTVSVNMFELSSRKRDEDGEMTTTRLKKPGRDSTLHLKDDMKGQLREASSVTSKAYSTFRKEIDPDLDMIGSGGEGGGPEESGEEAQMSPAIAIMKPILRYMQLLCENHNRDLQNFLRNQNNKTNYNLVCETLQFLDCICGSTTGGLGLLGLYINERNVALVNQTLETITEYCQGPCHENQTCIAKHESNGIDIIIALIVNSINPLGMHRMDLVLELKNNASKLLLAIMESRHDSENADKILYKMRPIELVDVMKEAYNQGVESESEEECGGDAITPKDVGHNIYILAHQLARHSKVLQQRLRPGLYLDNEGDEALKFYANHTAQIEIVRHDRTMEQIVFPVPNICEYLTEESKARVLTTTERDDQGSKVNDFFQQFDDLYNEMRWQKKIRNNPALFWFSRHISLWGSISFNLAVLVNLAVALFYPFGDDDDE